MKSITAAPEYKISRKRLSAIKPSPENLALYSAIEPDDPENIKLANSIKRDGLHEPLIVTADGFIVSGHRRYTALKLNGQIVVPCRVLPVRRDSMTKDDFVVLLREHNLQRYKSVAEQVRETLVDINPKESHANLCELRDKSIHYYDVNHVQTLKIEGVKTRHEISGQKADHVKFVKQVVFKDRRSYWPLSVRAVHYALLNYEFLRNIPRELWYRNDDESYDATANLICRMRLNGELPWEAFDDSTRPITTHRPFDNVRELIAQSYRELFVGYWRDLLQTQPNHVEVLVEKNTVYGMANRVTEKYQLPTSSGRGFNSIDPWHDLYLRYINSGKERLVVIVLSDYDPEGQMILHVGGRTLRDDFGVSDFDIIPAGVTKDQIERYSLPSQNFAKEGSSNHEWFVRRNGGQEEVYELEALEPADMLNDLEAVITSVLDMGLFNREAELEQGESAYLEAARKTAHEALKGLIE